MNKRAEYSVRQDPFEKLFKLILFIGVLFLTILDTNSYDIKINFCFVNEIFESSTFLGEEQVLA